MKNLVVNNEFVKGDSFFGRDARDAYYAVIGRTASEITCEVEWRDESGKVRLGKETYNVQRDENGNEYIHLWSYCGGHFATIRADAPKVTVCKLARYLVEECGYYFDDACDLVEETSGCHFTRFESFALTAEQVAQVLEYAEEEVAESEAMHAEALKKWPLPESEEQLLADLEQLVLHAIEANGLAR